MHQPLMRSAQVSLAVSAALLLSAAHLSPTWADEEADRSRIQKLTDQITAAQAKSDAAAIEALLADDYMVIHSDGSIANKAQELGLFRSGALKYQNIEIRERKIRLYGDTAVVNSLVSFSGTINGKPYAGDIRNTRIWVRQQGDWKCVLFQSTRPAAKSAS